MGVNCPLQVGANLCSSLHTVYSQDMLRTPAGAAANLHPGVDLGRRACAGETSEESCLSVCCAWSHELNALVTVLTVSCAAAYRLLPAAAWANTKLQRSGRCHESEVFNAFRRSSGRYRSAEVLPDSTLRDMVRNWHPGVERTRTGYLKNMSLQGLSSSDAARARAEAAAAAAAAADDSQQPSSGSDLLDNIAEAAAQDSSAPASASVEQALQRQ